MRMIFGAIFILLVLVLAICARIASASLKPIGKQVAWLLVALIPPVIGNFLIIVSGTELPATIGCYIYFLGMDLVMYTLLVFSFKYCGISYPHKSIQILVWLLLIADVIQYALNPFFHWTFTTEVIPLYGFNYYRMVPGLGQTLHRILDYGIFAAVLIIFLVKTIRAPRIYSERYSVILLSMIVGGIWQTFYIFSRTPLDRSMIGFAVFGILVFYFSLYYRPVRLLDSMLAGIASELPDALFFFDASGRCIWANRQGFILTRENGSDYDRMAQVLHESFEGLDAEGEWFSRQVLGTGDEARYYLLEKRLVTDTRKGAAGSFLRVRDTTKEQRDMQQEKYNASHDALTGLYRREYLYECIRKRLADQPDERWLILFLDLKNFKIVNDIFSHSFGDYALQCVADWIRGMVPENSVYGRLAGDTFGICMPEKDFDEDKIREEMSRFTVREGSIEHHLQMHLGVYEVMEKDLDVSVMFDRARMALSSVKGEYQTRIARYDSEMRQKALWDQHISSQLPGAISRRQIRPYLQPQVDKNGRIVGAEALVRWIHPDDGFLSPAAFIPVFEQNGMIAEVDKYMWRCACEILAGWQKENKDLFLSVNISPKDFYFMDVGTQLHRLVKTYGVDPSRLRLEITETVMMMDQEKRFEMLESLRSDGFLIEMDDFGSGYSSLNMLKDMPVDVLKIDMGFLNSSTDDERARTILQGIIRMSGELGIESLTEGVETKEQYRMLLDMGCGMFQGYYFSKPVPLEAFEALCEEQQQEGMEL